MEKIPILHVTTFFDARKKYYKLLDKEKEGNIKEKTVFIKDS